MLKILPIILSRISQKDSPIILCIILVSSLLLNNYSHSAHSVLYLWLVA